VSGHSISLFGVGPQKKGERQQRDYAARTKGDKMILFGPYRPDLGLVVDKRWKLSGPGVDLEAVDDYECLILPI
jgi:L-fucose isomerase-like protein